MDKKTEMRKILGSQTTDKSIHAQAIYEVLKQASTQEDRIELLEIALAEYSKVDKHDQVLSNKGINSEDWNEYNRKYTKMVSDFTRNAYFETKNLHDFTNEILRLIDFFKTEDEKSFCIATTIFTTNIIPYREIPGDPVRISEEEYKQLLLAHKDKSELILYLVKLPFFDWNEAASQVLQVVDEVDNKKLRVALLSLFMMSKIRSERE